MKPTLLKVAFSACRVWLGWQWFTAGLGKMGAAAWTGSEAGTALTGFVNGAIAKAAGTHPTVQGWYASFLESFVLPNAGPFAYVVAYGELLVGLGLIAGAFTGFAAVAGALMNLNFMLAGSTSSNPILYTAAIVVLAGLTYAQAYGIDAYLRPKVDQAAKYRIARVRSRWVKEPA